MKKTLLILLVLCLITVPAFAKRPSHTTIVNNVTNVTNTTVNEADDGTSVTGVKLDAPNLVKIDQDGDWTLGVEGGKAIMRGIFGDERYYVEADKGYFAFLKVTYNGCLLRCGDEE